MFNIDISGLDKLQHDLREAQRSGIAQWHDHNAKVQPCRSTKREGGNTANGSRH